MKISRVLVVLLLPLFLTGCLRIEGDLKSTADAKVTGVLEYGINKSLISVSGETWTLEKLQNSEEARDAKSICANGIWTENSQEFVMTCNLNASQLTDPDLYLKVIDNKIEFHFAQNLDSDESTMELGSLRMSVNFPGEIISIKENKPGLVTKSGVNQISIKAAGTAKVNVTVSSGCGVVCGTVSSAIALGTNNKPYAIAPKNTGGLITENLRFTKANSPYTLNSTLQVPKDLSVIVDEDVEIIYNGLRYGSKDNSVKHNQDAMFYIHGNIYFNGNESKPIRLSGMPKYYFLVEGSKENANILISGVIFQGGSALVYGSGGYAYFSLKNSIILDVVDSLYIWYPTKPLVIEGNIFKNSGGMSIGFDGRKSEERPSTPQVTVKKNLFIGPSTTGYWIENWAAYGSTLYVTSNAFTEGPYTAVGIAKGHDSTSLDASGNYWGTSDQTKIHEMVKDSKDGLDFQAAIKTDSPLSTSPVSALETRAAVFFAGNAVIQALNSANDATKAVQDKVLAAQEKVNASKNKSSQKIATKAKEITIKCQKGKSELKVIGVKPICPTGYKKVK